MRDKRFEAKNASSGGFASIVIALVLIIIISLLAVGFAQLARREQQSALNQQLANQAYFAAETGVNDALKDIADNKIKKTTNHQGGTDCITTADVPNDALTKNHDLGGGASYTCLMVNLEPLELSKTVAGGESWTTQFTTVGGVPKSITIQWSSVGTPLKKPFDSSHNTSFTPETGPNAWSGPSVLQTALTPLNSFKRNDLISSTFTSYLYPAAGGGTVNMGNASTSGIAKANCPLLNAGASCTVVINNVPAVNTFLLNILAIYDKSQVVVTAQDASGTNLPFANAQKVIDVTGKARTVLKRIRVAVPYKQPVDLPKYGIEAQNICKRPVTEPGGTYYQEPGGATASGNSPCNLNN